jgi:hypothetical protein
MMSNARRNLLAPPAAVLFALATLALSACSSTGDVLSDKLGGLPADAPQRPATTLPAPNVYEVRPTREARPLSDDEQKKLESELTTLRESQKTRANPPPPPPPKKVAAPVKKAVTTEKKAEKKAVVPEKKAAAKEQVVPPTKQPAGPAKLMN